MVPGPVGVVTKGWQRLAAWMWHFSCQSLGLTALGLTALGLNDSPGRVTGMKAVKSKGPPVRPGNSACGTAPGSGAACPAHYRPRAPVWVSDTRDTDAATRPAPVPLRVLVWNIWFGTHRWRERLDAVLAEIENRRPHLIGLQEVTPRQLEVILNTAWVRAGFVASDEDGSTLMPDGVLLLSRLPVRRMASMALPSRRHRKLVCADLSLEQGPLRVVVTHLESGADQVARRTRQLSIAQRMVLRATPGLILGDLNFDPERDPEEARMSPALIDCWRALRGDAAGYTLDGSANAMRGEMAKSDFAFRSDRLLLCPEDGRGIARWRPLDIHRIGMDAIDDGASPLYPSDHFGLVADMVPIVAPTGSATVLDPLWHPGGSGPRTAEKKPDAPVDSVRLRSSSR